MGVLLKNNATSRLASSLTAGATTLSVTSGDGAKFPSPTAGQWFPLTVIKASGTLEIMRCTARSGDVLTVVRAQEGTAAQAFTAGDRVELRITAGALAEFKQTDTISAFMQGMLDDANAAEARNTLGLGNVATNTQVAAPDDVETNRILAVGWLGLGTDAMDLPGNDWNNATLNGATYNSNDGANAPGPGWWIGTYLCHNDHHGTQVAYFFTGTVPRVKYRNKVGGVWHPWVEGRHSGNMYPVGAQYIQFAEADGSFSPAKSPATLFGGTWTLKFNTESVFFRTEGALAAKGRAGGVQGDAIRNITGSLGEVYIRSNSFGNETGAFVPAAPGTSTAWAGVNATSKNSVIFDASRVVPVAQENRVTNRLIRVWERTA